tara:strand:- start:3123 stop:3572 length:450 start_codon:yes stop_codon:yes gene_type:complete
MFNKILKGIFNKNNNSKPDWEGYKEKYGKNNIESIYKDILMAQQIKREGNFEGANLIYIRLNNKYGKNPAILKSWGKTLICLLEYEDAINKFEEACEMYKEFKIKDECLQCDIHINHIRSRYDNPEFFKKWVSDISGKAIHAKDVKLNK